MIFYKIDIKLNEPPDLEYAQNGKIRLSRRRTSELDSFNEELKNLHEESATRYFFQLTEVNEKGRVELYAVFNKSNILIKTSDIMGEMGVCFKKLFHKLEIISADIKEISAFEYANAHNKYGFCSYADIEALTDIFDNGHRGFFSRDSFDFFDRIIEAETVKDKEDALNILKTYIHDDVFPVEIARIFSDSHPKEKYYGIPVHYKISANSTAVADDMTNLLVASLYTNNRVLSRRITKVDNIKEYMRDSEEFEKLMLCSKGSTVQIVLTGNAASESQYASEFHNAAEFIAENVKKNSDDVLFIFIEDVSRPGFGKQVFSKIDEDLDLIEINEGVGDAIKARSYFMNLLANSDMEEFYNESDNSFEEDKFYSASEVHKQFNRWRKACLKDRVYTDYRKTTTLKIDKETVELGSAYERLEAMVGLKEVKSIIQDIISANKAQKLREEYYKPNAETSKHLIFTGNPGTAKTTVARLMTEIMKENHILKSGAFIEVGRSDLVARYVGWTAKTVREKFKQAQGGVLFIDEAYALIDGSRSFGDEAINTIVQEMENRRGDVIVIFAGYPDKMREFLEMNEGLRSRIAFYVNFPDYSPTELQAILQKMMSKRQFVLGAGATEKTLKIFNKVYRQNEYGNGRFVRNLLEQTINRQASRLFGTGAKEASREDLFTLMPQDFDTNITKLYEGNSKQIGFV